MESGHFDKFVVKKKQGKKAPQGKSWELFLLDTLKNYTFNRKFNSKMDKIRTSFSKIRTLFSVFKIGQGKRPPPSPLVAGEVWCNALWRDGSYIFKGVFSSHLHWFSFHDVYLSLDERIRTYFDLYLQGVFQNAVVRASELLRRNFEHSCDHIIFRMAFSKSYYNWGGSRSHPISIPS